MKSRKTISVQFMLDYANKQLAQEENEVVTKEFKEGVSAMITRILLSTNNYNGFFFINNEDSELNTFGFFTRRYM